MDFIMNRMVFAVFAAFMFFNASVADAQMDRRRPVHSRPSGAEGLGVTFGYVNSSYRTTDWATDEVEKTPALNGFAVSMTKDFALIRSALYIQSGLGYTYQTRSRDMSAESLAGVFGTKIISDRKEHFLSVPVRLKYTLPLLGRIGISVDAGPVLLVGLSSKMNFRTRFNDETSGTLSYNVYGAKFKSSGVAEGIDFESWAKDNAGLPYGKVRRFDVLLGASIGADFFSLLEVRAGYDWGLVNKYKGDIAADKKMYRGQFTLSVGLRF